MANEISPSKRWTPMKAILRNWLFPTVFGCFLVGYACQAALGLRQKSTADVSIFLVVSALAVASAAWILWRSTHLRVSDDLQSNRLEIFNLWRTYRISARDVDSAGDSSYQALRFQRGASRLRYECAALHLKSGRDVKVLASISDGDDPAVRSAVKNFCSRNNVTWHLSE
jgi:hypothetical protein